MKYISLSISQSGDIESCDTHVTLVWHSCDKSSLTQHYSWNIPLPLGTHLIITLGRCAKYILCLIRKFFRFFRVLYHMHYRIMVFFITSHDQISCVLDHPTCVYDLIIILFHSTRFNYLLVIYRCVNSKLMVRKPMLVTSVCWALGLRFVGTIVKLERWYFKLRPLFPTSIQAFQLQTVLSNLELIYPT